MNNDGGNTTTRLGPTAHWDTDHRHQKRVPFSRLPMSKERQELTQHWHRHCGLVTTNAIEALDSRVRETVQIRGHFLSDEAATNLIWLELRNVAANWKSPPPLWHRVRQQLVIQFVDVSLSPANCNGSHTKSLTVPRKHFSPILWVEEIPTPDLTLLRNRCIIGQTHGPYPSPMSLRTKLGRNCCDPSINAPPLLSHTTYDKFKHEGDRQWLP